MNQRISVRAIIRNKEKTLLIRRSTGRQTILGKYELPGGRIDYREQPEDALVRHLNREAGLTIQSAQIFDVLTYVDHDDRDVQYLFILYLVSLEQGTSNITLSTNYDHYQWKSLSNIHQDELTESARLLLGISEQHHTQSSSEEKQKNNDVSETTDLSHVIVYSDGGSRGNPGPSASGFVVMNEEERVIHQGGLYLGITTNNQAEYHGVRLGLEKAKEIGARTVDFRLDSLLVTNQLNGIYKIKNRDLWPINERIKHLVTEFDKVSFTHVRREFNQLADGMVNKILNEHAQS